MLPDDWRRRFSGGWEPERPLARRTTWRIGGPADLLLEPATAEELAGTVERLWRIGIPYRVLGGGSNLLVADRGVRGVVLSLDRLDRVEHGDDWLLAEAGASLHAVVTYAARHGLGGIEALTGIPGRVGGAVFGNAGSRLGAIGDAVLALDLMEPDGSLVHVVPEPGFFRYRSSDVKGHVVVRAYLETRRGDAARLRARVLELLRERRRSQPGWVGNAGCVFKNPPGDGAGRLIDAAGCKGARVGGIAVSRKHANFFENVGGGTEADVLRLVDAVRERVRKAHGVELEMEVRRWT